MQGRLIPCNAPLCALSVALFHASPHTLLSVVPIESNRESDSEVNDMQTTLFEMEVVEKRPAVSLVGPKRN